MLLGLFFFALTFNVIIFTMMLDGIKTRLNTNKREANSGVCTMGQAGGRRETFTRDTNISCLILVHLKIKAEDVCMPVMPIKDDVAHNYEHAQSHTIIHIHKYVAYIHIQKYTCLSMCT